MSGLAILIPIALFMGLCGLGFFFWAMRNGQFEDLEGASHRVLIDDEDAGESSENSDAET
ncbi:cbb3-type cytochrome oxidase assembly protein CcoS [Sphingorhabdus sp. Alg239-R122]|uniref:cbb3-type cytochrome oxidase assembly protein CcoS n=1 Tax=Sphingorhabdus sp. Alg239-R122 TaxID=2305989 RepID=UPI0013DBAEC3|nr:cbb3-type cytochrome oxidase assembly protein CcoS [Sphingorhabdus sp. Alg239-R122]